MMVTETVFSGVKRFCVLPLDIAEKARGNKSMNTAAHTSLVASLFSLILFGHVHAGHEDLWVEIDYSEYLNGVSSRETLLRQSADDLSEMRAELELLLPMLAEADAQLKAATVKFAELEKSPDDSSERHDAWQELIFAHSRWNELEIERDQLLMAVNAAENDHEITAIRLEKYKNDYEAQSDPFAVRDGIARCGSADCSAASSPTSAQATGSCPAGW